MHLVVIRHLQQTYSARETGVMQGLEKHSQIRLTDAPAALPIQLQRNFVRAFPGERSFDTHYYANSEIPATNIAGSQRKNIYCLINNRTKDFCQNLKLYTFLDKIHQDLDFETKIVGIR